MVDNRSSKGLPGPHIQLVAANLPVLSILLAVYDPGGKKVRPVQGDLDGYEEVGAMPPLERWRI